MRQLLPVLLLGFGWLQACNASLVEEKAPELVSTSWVLPEAASKPDLEEAWRLYAFFLPT